MSLRIFVALLVALVALCVCTRCCGAAPTGSRDGSLNEEEMNELRARLNNRLLAVPHSLARFLSYNSRGFNLAAPERPADSPGRPLSGYKRSSSALDALTGVTLGKRSANPLDFVNFEPLFARQTLSRGPARAYDMRWAPFDSIEVPSSTLSNFK